MLRVFLLSLFLFFASFTVRSQVILRNKKDSVALNSKKLDSVKVKTKYVNPGKIAGRRAMIRSAMLPGLGQIRNGFTIYRGLKVAGIYTGATLLTLSYIDNSKNYKIFHNELTERLKNGDKSPEGSLYARYPTSGLIQAKDTFRRNKEVIKFSFVGLYLFNIIEAYIDARLKYFDVGDVTIRIAPDMINTNTMYGLNSAQTPGMKISFTF